MGYKLIPGYEWRYAISREGEVVSVQKELDDPIVEGGIVALWKDGASKLYSVDSIVKLLFGEENA